MDFSSLSADTNKEAIKMVVEAVVADHGGFYMYPWSAAEMKDNCACCNLLLGLWTSLSTIKQIHTFDLTKTTYILHISATYVCDIYVTCM